MDWNTIYPGPEPPTEAELAAYVETPLWTELVHYLSQAYHTDPVCTYSTCSMGRGWNVKYRAGGAALCTLYPGAGAFVCLIVAGCRLGKRRRAALANALPWHTAAVEGDKTHVQRRALAFPGGGVLRSAGGCESPVGAQAQTEPDAVRRLVWGKAAPSSTT